MKLHIEQTPPTTCSSDNEKCRKSRFRTFQFSHMIVNIDVSLTHIRMFMFCNSTQNICVYISCIVVICCTVVPLLFIKPRFVQFTDQSSADGQLKYVVEAPLNSNQPTS